MTAAASSPFPTAPVVVGATHQHDPQLLAPTSGSSLLRPRAPSRTASSASTASNNPFYDPDDPWTGHVGHLNEPQQQALAAFKALAFAEKIYVPEPPTFDEATLLRFLRARRWDPPSALKQLKEAEAWRKTSNVDEFFRNHEISTFEDARKVYPVWTGRRTKSGHPFYVYRVQDLDKKSMARYLENSSKKSATPGAKHPATVVALYQYLLECMCPLMTMLKDRPHPEVPISASCNIVDISGVSIMQFFGLRGHLGDASTLATARYPETLDSILIVGAPPYMDTVFSFISQFFDAQTRAKIKILGSATDPAATLAGLREYIHDADIPKAYGGGLDWEFGGRPNIDPEIKRAFGLEDDFEWPEGPVAIHAERGEIQAVGTRANGKRRREVIAEIKPDAYDVD